MTENEGAVLFCVIVSSLFLLVKLIGRQQSHQLAGVNYDLWPVLAWFGVDLGLLGVSFSVLKETARFKQMSYSEATLFCLVLILLTATSWIAYGRFVKRYSTILESNKQRVWTDFQACAWIFLSLYCGFFGFGVGVVVQGLTP